MNLKKIIFGTLLTLGLTSVCNAEIFTDVADGKWYANEVQTAYEMSLMNGMGGGLFSPDGDVTVAEAVTMAARASALILGEAIPDYDGEW